MIKALAGCGTSIAVVAAFVGCSAGSADGEARGRTDGTTSTGSGGNDDGSSSSSGSGASTSTGAGATGGTLNVPMMDAGADGDNCGQMSFDLERKPAEVLLLLDRSASMQDGPEEDDPVSDTNPRKWDLSTPAIIQVIQETDTSISWGLKTFPDSQDTDACADETISDTIHVPVGELNGQTVVDTIDATLPEGDGTPTGFAVNSGVAHMQGVASDNPKYIVLTTDGEPSCSPSGPGQDEAIPFAVDEVEAAYAANVPVFVIGVATTKDDATQAMNDMAVAGGVARTDPNPLATKYYLAETQAELTEALRAITGGFLGCVFPLGTPPPVPDNIGVRIGGELAPQDTTQTDGWNYTTEDYQGVEVFGSWCDAIKTTNSNMVEIIYGCPNIPVE